MEIILDPRSIQWMLVSGGGLLVTGMVIWLASLGFFDDPKVVAASLGSATLLLLGAGWYVIRNTTFQLAGKAVTLLACLIMPLNLWFYHLHSLLTLDGNLWIAAAACCALYAASALVLRDRLFVYVLMAGLAGTGMLVLTDLHRFAEIAAPSVMLAAMGLAAIHVERLFPIGEGPFSRDKFGMAFFRSGHALLAGGLMLVLGAQLVGWFILPGGVRLPFPTPEITVEPGLRLLVLGIVLSGFWGYVYSGLVQNRTRRFVVPSIATLLWAELLGLELLNFTYRAETILIISSLTGLLMLTAGRFLTSFRQIASRVGNGIMTLAFIGSTMLVLARAFSFNAAWVNMWLAIAMSAMSFAAMVVVGPTGWRRGHTLMGIASAALAGLVIVTLSHLNFLEKIEIATVLVGLAMLTTAHIGWYREQDVHDDGVSFSLFFGSLLAGVPLLIAAVAHRFTGGISLPDEIALLTISALMVTSGLMLQLRSTTIIGGSLLTLHIAMLLGVAGWEAQWALGVYLFIGGSVIFLIGLGLAIYRERLIALPERIHRREGVFKVLAWR